MNHIKLTGNVVAGPTIHPSEKNASIVARVTLAVAVPNRPGKQHIEIVAFGYNADELNMRATLDTQLHIVGHAESRGHYGVQLVADYVKVLDGGLVVAAR